MAINPFRAWFFLEQGMPSSEIKDCVCFVLRGNEEQMNSNTRILSGNQRGD